MENVANIRATSLSRHTRGVQLSHREHEPVIQDLRLPTSGTTDPMSRCVIVGGSVAGLLAAAAEVGAYCEIVIFERDDLDADVAFRRGTPQARHPHILLSRGLDAIEQLLPGFREEMEDNAAVFDPGQVFRLAHHGRKLPQLHTDLHCQLATRSLFEACLREHVRKLPGVRIDTGASVTGLLTTSSRDQVVGVTTSAGGRFEADLVIDASGRTSQAGKWLTELGYSVPADDVVNAGTSYATVWFVVPDPLCGSTTMLYEFGQWCSRGRGGGVAILQSRQACVSLFGCNRYRMPSTIEAFIDFIDELDNPDLSAFVRTHAATAPIYRYDRIANRRRLFHRMRRWPVGLLVVGDAACVLNPIYGQGMTIAALQAITMREMSIPLRQHPHLAAVAQKRLAQTATVPWIMATTQDRRWIKNPPWSSAVTGWALDRIADRMPTNPALQLAYFKAQHQLAPTALLSPRSLTALLQPNRLAKRSAIEVTR